MVREVISAEVTFTDVHKASGQFHGCPRGKPPAGQTVSSKGPSRSVTREASTFRQQMGLAHKGRAPSTGQNRKARALSLTLRNG